MTDNFRLCNQIIPNTHAYKFKDTLDWSCHPIITDNSVEQSVRYKFLLNSSQTLCSDWSIPRDKSRALPSIGWRPSADNSHVIKMTNEMFACSLTNFY